MYSAFVRQCSAWIWWRVNDLLIKLCRSARLCRAQGNRGFFLRFEQELSYRALKTAGLVFLYAALRGFRMAPPRRFNRLAPSSLTSAG